MIEELFGAIRDRNLARVTELIASDPAVLSRRNAQGISPLSWAAYLELPVMVEALRARRGTPDFHEACIVGDDAVVRAALAGGQDVDAPAPDGFVPLGLAVFFRQGAIARLLIDAGADVNARAANAQQVAPVHAAVARNDLAMLELLLLQGADPDAPQARGFRPLHGAALGGHTAAVALLLMFGADVAAATEEGQRAADLARRSGHTALAERLALISGRRTQRAAPASR